jgi:hypothetical protein
VANFAADVKKKLADTPKTRILVGTYVSTDGVRATVDVGGGRIPADFCGYEPEVNESVRILFLDGTATLLGPSKLRPGRGTITDAPAANLVPVSTDAGDFDLPYAAGLSLSAGQVVKLGGWNDGGFVFAVMSTSPTPGDAPPPPGGGGGDETKIFTAVDAGSYRGGWWTAQVYASDTNTGAFFYGTKIADTIPDGAVIVSIEMYCSISMLDFQAPNIGVHSSASKPSGNVSIAFSAPVNIFNGWVTLPTSHGDYLKANYGGIGIDGGGYSILNSLAGDPQSGALRIHYRS